MGDINWAAAIIAGVVGFFVGGAWYAVFAKAWTRETGITGHEPATMSPVVRYGIGTLLSVAGAILLSRVLGPNPPLQHAVMAGAAVGAGFVATSFGINYLFEGKSVRLWLINGGYHVAQYTVIGLILGLWRW